MQGMTQQSEDARPAMRQFQGTNGGNNMKDVFAWDTTTSNHKQRQQAPPPPPPPQDQQTLTRPVRKTANQQSYNILAPESA